MKLTKDARENSIWFTASIATSVDIATQLVKIKDIDVNIIIQILNYAQQIGIAAKEHYPNQLHEITLEAIDNVDKLINLYKTPQHA